MANYKLTNKAVEDLTIIWDYTFEKWSERQADKYYEVLLENCGYIGNDPKIVRFYDGISDELYGFKVNRHIKFYRILTEKPIEITRILHEHMDLKNRIIE